jgi:hypothetical protein
VTALARRAMKGWSLFVLASAGVIAASGWLLGLRFTAPNEHRSIWISAAVAFVVQLATFAIARRSAPRDVMVGWGIGALVRFAVLALYAFVIIEALGLASSAALISLATFLFVSLLVESLLVSV